MTIFKHWVTSLFLTEGKETNWNGTLFQFLPSKLSPFLRVEIVNHVYFGRSLAVILFLFGLVLMFARENISFDFILPNRRVQSYNYLSIHLYTWFVYWNPIGHAWLSLPSTGIYILFFNQLRNDSKSPCRVSRIIFIAIDILS